MTYRQDYRYYGTYVVSLVIGGVGGSWLASNVTTSYNWLLGFILFYIVWERLLKRYGKVEKGG